jgi:hypothetical protein
MSGNRIHKTEDRGQKTDEWEIRKSDGMRNDRSKNELNQLSQLNQPNKLNLECKIEF